MPAPRRRGAAGGGGGAPVTEGTGLTRKPAADWRAAAETEKWWKILSPNETCLQMISICRVLPIISTQRWWGIPPPPEPFDGPCRRVGKGLGYGGSFEVVRGGRSRKVGSPSLKKKLIFPPHHPIMGGEGRVGRPTLAP